MMLLIFVLVLVPVSALFVLTAWRIGYQRAVVLHEGQKYWDKLARRSPMTAGMRLIEWILVRTILRGL